MVISDVRVDKIRVITNVVCGIRVAHISAEEIQDYIVYLLSERKLAVGTCHAIITGPRFFYALTLEQDEASVHIPQVKEVTRLPEILSPEQLERLFAAPRNPKHRVLLMTAYSGGLRVSELVHLKVTDIHSDRMMIRVDEGKGRKDRYTLLSKRLLSELRAYWKIKRPPVWLFPGIHLRKPGWVMLLGTADVKKCLAGGCG